MKQILIKFLDSMDDKDAIEYVKEVILQGKISGNGKFYCYISEFDDGTKVSVSEKAKHPTFQIW